MTDTCDICGKKADKFYNIEGDRVCSECVERWEKQQDTYPSYLGNLKCAEAEDYKNLEADNKRLKNKIDLALLELAHILGEKTPTEIRVEQALKEE